MGLQFNLSPRWAIGTGIRYTNLGRTLVGDSSFDRKKVLERISAALK